MITPTVAGADTSANIQSASTGVSAQEDNSASSLQNQFLTLMVAQINNQNPLEPQDGTEFVSQLAQFSQVESSENLVKLTQTNQVLLDNLQVLSTSTLVDQNVSVRTDSIQADGESVINGSIDLSANSNVVNLVITDSKGGEQTISLGANAKGKVDFSLDTEKLGLKGDYSIKVDVDEDQGYSPTTTVNGQINSVIIPSNGGSTVLNVQGVGEVPYYEISSFS
ncbi:flagellar hook capping FlgD N-terminal domain-containing protein [Vibrio casei]|uniref:Basal-body rod modification protein FlgD n=1 Tax=Vibrio casei TaxID=673372 RepID=A0A368LJ79_9VIBR|nr:flagellar hook capping FlgD N-terminal domain-containing protein [Vibrio casei]RCS70731.1 flagellar hook assembly protein FlgD [Vibrio casei]SJN26586.1 Flagellar basal-body rod modification protein FlgD [Vibrio casei]